MKRPFEVCDEAIGNDDALEFHSVALLIARVHKLLVLAQVTHGTDGAVDESVERHGQCPMCVEHVRGEERIGIPVQKKTSPIIDKERRCRHYFRHSGLQLCVLGREAPLILGTAQSRA
jgi:hypothetical protein